MSATPTTEPKSTTLQPEADALRARLKTLEARLTSACSDLSAEDLARAPRPEAWSAGAVLEHLILGDGLYIGAMREVAARARARGRLSTGAAWRPSLLGGLLERSLRPTAQRKMRAPKVLRPGPTPRANVVDVYREQQEVLAKLLDECADLDWTRIRMSSPVLAWVRINLGDAFHVLASHAERHMAQIERVRAELGLGR